MFTNSPLVTYINLTKNKTTNRNNTIDTITIHCFVGQVTAKQGCDYFATTERQCSANYVVGYDGSIGLSVEEKDRSWCSGGKDSKGNVIKVNGISGAMNDHRAVTIEVASGAKEPYEVTDAAYKALIALVADICQRNDIKKLLWQGKKNLVGDITKQNMTVHRWFANKSCPGTYLYDRHGEIAAEVNKRLGADESKVETPATTSAIKKGDVVSINSDSATYYDGKKKVPAWVRKKKWIVKEVKGDRAVIDQSQDGKNAICSPINVKFLTVDGAKVEAPKTETFKSYLAKVTASALNIRKGAGTNFAVTGVIRDKGTYTIVAESKGQGSTKGWGKLKSGAGWISLDFVKKV